MPTIKEILQQKERENTAMVDPYSNTPAARKFINNNKQRLANILNDWNNGKKRRS